MKIKMVVERGTGRLLGAQIVGGEDAGKRIDVLATALWNGMTVAEVAGMDLAYAPPFSPVWDPVLLAAGKAAEGDGFAVGALQGTPRRTRSGGHRRTPVRLGLRTLNLY